jgi:hypothetical protein
MGFIAADFLKQGLGKPLTFITGAMLGLGTFALLLSLPAALVVTDDCLEEVHWFWRNKRIRWKEIVEIETSANGRTVTVSAANGARIIHSRLHADRPRFLLELKRHCGDQLPQDFPREPIPTEPGL